MIDRYEIRRHFAPRGPCLICGCKTLGAVHRLIDAIRDRHQGGESLRSLAADYEIPYGAIRYVTTTPLRQLNWLRRIR